MVAKDRIIAGRTSLILDQPFFGSLALRLDLVEITDAGFVPTMATDGKRLYYNPTFVDSITRDELLGCVAHEVLHCANGHPWRRDNRDPKRFNIAADYAINPIIREAGFKLPAGVLLDPQYAGHSAEWIYDRLPVGKKDDDDDGGDGQGGKQGKSGKQGKQAQDGQPGQGKPQGQGQGQGQGKSSQQGQGAPGQGATSNAAAPGAGASDVLDVPPGVEDEGTTEEDWQQAVQQAAAAAKARGNLPASLARFAKGNAQPKVDWRSVLRRFVQQAARADYSWTRPNVRHMARGLYLPALRSEQMGTIAVAIDTSGSIDQVTLDQFASEVRAIASEVRPERVVVIYCDARINRVDTFELDDDIKLKMCGGGGTSHVPVMDKVDNMDETPVCLVCLTDLMTEHRKLPPSMPVLWATTCPGTAPYGEVVQLEQ